MDYKKVLIATDLADETDKVIAAGVDIARLSGAHIGLVHVCDHHITGYSEYIAQGHLANEMQLREVIFPLMKKKAEQFDIPIEDIHIYFGRVAEQLHGHASNFESDLIVIGSHGKGGVRALLGSAANAVVHGAECNVLLVRV